MAQDAYYTSEHYRQQRRLLVNGDPRALICFCIDVSQSMNEWWIEEGGLRRNQEGGVVDGHRINYFDIHDIRPGYEHYQKIVKLNETLSSLLTEIKADRDVREQVAVSIVTYSDFARVKYDFLDCEELNISNCQCSVEKDKTAMGDGIRTSLAQIDEMRSELIQANNDHYTPILVIMTDGTPTDDPRGEFATVRERVEKGDLFIYPLGIGEGADMSKLMNMFPTGQIPASFKSRYKMIRPGDYKEIFQEIKSHITRSFTVMVSESSSTQSAPAVENQSVSNNQMGESLLDDTSLLDELIFKGVL